MEQIELVDKSDVEKQRAASDQKQLFSKNIAQVVYLCQLLSFFFGITAIIGIILNYLKYNEVKNTWLESHFHWQTRTFWIGFMFACIGFVLKFILVGFLILAVNLVWIIYRVIKGYLLLSDDLEAPKTLI
jgi:uncharacterized membrane protein